MKNDPREGSSEARLRHVSEALSSQYNNPRHHNKADPLDELMFIILSAKTSEPSYLRTYDALKKEFPNWFAISDTDPGTVAKAIASGGLSKKKEDQIRALLYALRKSDGGLSMETLRDAEDEKVEAYLTSLPGIGLKSARCVMMYSLGRMVFPVDTHCRRVLSRLGFIESRRLTDRVQDEVQAIVPPDMRYNLHVNLVAHGRAVCLSRKPRCPACIARDECRYYEEHKPAVLRMAP